MATEISLVIRGEDAFSSAFEALDEAFGTAQDSGQKAQGTLSEFDDALLRIKGSAEDAGQQAVSFAGEMAGSFTTIVEEQAIALDALALRQEETETGLSESLLAINEAYHEQRLAQQTQAHAAMEEEERRSTQVLTQLSATLWQNRLELAISQLNALAELSSSHNRDMVRFAKAVGIAQALMDAYRAANSALATVPYPFNLSAAALVLAEGLANVERIREVNTAHGGLNFVPDDQTFLLQRGERVLSPTQNRDLTTFLEAGGQPGGRSEVVVQTLNLHVLENATSAEALLEMDPDELRRVVAERIIPALDALASLGIRPNFVESNT